NTVELNSAVDVEFENVTIYAGTYGLRARGTGPLKFVNSAIHGNIPPWGFRVENSLHGASPAQQAPFAVPEGTSYPGRNVARLNTHAVLVTEGSYEFEVFYYPHNHDREIAYSEFTDGHDGIYLSGHGVRFHHNHVHRFQDDAIYLSAPSPWHNDDIHIYQNLIRHVGMAFGMHTRGCPEGRIYIYRNICDQREGVNWHRPSDKDPRGHVFSNLPLVIHGRKFLGSESIYVYHNLFVSPNRGGSLAYGALTARNHESTSRWVMNNIMVYLPTANRQWPFRGGGLRGNPSPLSSDIILDGNIHWCPDPKVPVPENFMERIRQVEGGDFASRYPHAWETQGQAVDPEFTAFSTDPTAVNDYHLRPDSPAIGAGARLPALLEQTGTGDERIGSLPDVEAYRSAKERRPDVGPVPFGVKQLNVGRHGHVDALRFTPSQAPR
ncbi:MAG: hypothetical protein K9N51_13030, partial [Candidatus Pacebacteria bacterium]|nr:hypothetical protein [Candidatus Paceibacterota bacterium]